MSIFNTIKETFDEFYGSLPIPVFLSDEKTRLVKANQPFLNLIKRSEEEIINLTYTSLVRNPVKYFEEDMACTGGHVRYLTDLMIGRGEVVPVELIQKKLLKEDGSQNGCVVFITDLGKVTVQKEKEKRVTIKDATVFSAISGSKQAKKELIEKNSFLRKIVETSTEGIAISDTMGNIFSANKALEKITGHSKKEIEGKHYVEIVVKDELDRKKIQEAMVTLYDKGSASFDTIYRRKDGSPAYVEVEAIMIKDEAGEYIASAGFIRDVTEKKKAEQVLDEVNRCRKEFFTNISHEFRTPLALAMGPLEAILRGECGKISGVVRKLLSLSLKNSHQLLELINQLLEFSKLESGAQTLVYEKRNIKEFIASILDSFAFITTRKKINLNFSAGKNETEAYIDPAKVETVLYNLIGNAVKFTPEGGSITVSIGVGNSLGHNGNGHITMLVKDTGIGIKEKDLPHIFERFRQANGSTSREYGGSGIGLALSRELVELMEGSIEVKSEYGKGSTFSVHLPSGNDCLEQDSCNANGAEETTSHRLGREPSASDYDREHDVIKEHLSGTKPLILIIDDNPDMRNYISDIIKKEYDFITARNGREGLKSLAEYPPALILCDLMMPEMDGHEFLKQVKSNPKYRHIPLIFLTARADIEMKIEGLEEGADDYIVKPFNSLELRARVRSSLRIRELLKENMVKEEKIISLTREIKEKYHHRDIVGKSEPMRKIFQLIDMVKESDSTVILIGETGTGKEVIASTLHYDSPRKDGPFVAVNCGAIPKNLLESEFFGHVKGAYTGADQGRKGYFEKADGGTLFLDEIGELDKDLQVKLLRMLDSGGVVRVGSSELVKVNVKLIAATNKDLRAEIRKGNFREDLYYRIYVVPIHIPPLRERKEDIPLLIEHFLKKMHPKLKKEPPSFPEEIMKRLLTYHYPGNVRELEHIIERQYLLGGNDESVFDASPEIPDKFSSPSLYGALLSSPHPLKRAAANAERDIIIHALKMCGNSYNQTARKLNIGVSSLYRKMKEYGVQG